MLLAFALINSVPDKSEWVLDRIREIEGVKEAYRLYGVYDIVAVVEAETTEELKETITRIRRLEHALTSLTLPVVS